MIAPRFWAQMRPTWTARALSPFGAVYGAATARRMARRGVKVSAPVVCVGNFVVGGAGKTPTALAIAKMLQAAGERIAFLSRGYGGASRSEPLRVDPSMHGARLVGDEPLLLARAAPCYVGADRVAAAQAAIEAGSTALIMDDGLQNPSLAKDIRLAVVDGDRLFGNRLCLPAGPLRAPLTAQLPFVDAIVLIGGGPDAVGVVRNAAPGKPIFRARLQPDAVAAARLVGRPVLAFSGIARPEKFFESLAGIGARVAATRIFADHHLFRPEEIEALLAQAAARNLKLVTTEKDNVRIAPIYGADIATLPVSLRFDAPEGLARWLVAGLSAARFRGEA